MNAIIDFFLELLRINLVASIVILVIMVARLILIRAPKVFSYALWAIVLIRLLIPVSIPSQVSMIPDAPVVSGAAVNSILPEIEFQTIRDMEQNYYESLKTPDEGSVRFYIGRSMEPMSYLPIVWLAGIACMALYSCISYWKIRKKIQIAVPLRDNILIADDIKTPFVIGLFNPKIYLPGNLGEREQEYILLHEQHHIRRFDHIMKALGFLALTIHWFNPLVWLAFGLACKDMEMSCDEAVIGTLGSDVRSDYSASLLTLATGRRIIAGTPLAFGEGDTKGRIKNLAKWKKPAVWVLVLAMLICLVLGACLLTDRVNRNGQHIGVTFYYGCVTEQKSEEANPYIRVLCNDGSTKVFYYEAENEDVSDELVGKQVKIRARLQDVTGNLITSQVDQVRNDRFENLEDAIQNAILTHHSYERDQEVLECASFFTYASEGSSPVGADHAELITEYGIVYHQNYRLVDGALVEEGGCNVPTVLTFRVDEDDQYLLAEYWEPRDGSFYPEDIRAKYPAFVWPDTQKNLREQKNAIFDQVMSGFGVGTDVVIEYLLTDICGCSQWANGFGELMEMCSIERDLLVHYGTDTLEYCFEQFREGDQDDLYGQVMAYVCSEILDARGIKPLENWSFQQSGQDWFDAFTSQNPECQTLIPSGAEN